MDSDRSASDAEPAIVRTEDGAEIAVWSLGRTDADSVLLLHGFSLDHTTWEPVAARLAASGYRVVMPDLRGHGRSTLGSAPPTSGCLVQDVSAIADELQLAAVHIVGHSLGAVIALAARTDEKLSGQVRSITAIAGTERAIQNPVMRVGARLFSSTLGIAMLKRKQPGRTMISTWFGKNPDPEQLDRTRMLYTQCEPETRQEIAQATGSLDLRPSFALRGPPALVMVGRLDKATPVKVSRRIAEAIAHAELAVVEDAGHMVIVEQPHSVADRLVSWFADHL